MLRQTRLKVIDEVANGLSYYDYTFFREMPRLYAAIEDELAAQDPKVADRRVKPFLRVGCWIGGDRDGNPFVTADVLSEATRLQSARALGHYLDELHELGGELSLSATLSRVTPELAALADRSSDTAAARRDEPYRRAIAGVYARLAKTAETLDHVRRVASADRRRAGLRDPGGIRRRSRDDLRFARRAAARKSSRADDCARCGVRSTCSASTSRRSTCGRTRTCTSAPSRNCSPPPSPASNI